MASTQLIDFVSTLYGNGTPGYLEVRSLSKAGVKQEFLEHPVDMGKLQNIVAAQRNTHDVYFGVATRRQRKGSGDSLGKLTALFTDVDRGRESLDAFRLPPSVILFSGRGYHCQWLLREPLDVSTPEGLEKAKDLLRRLAAAVGGDPGSAEPAHILRLPETINHKPNVNKETQLEKLDASIVYSVEDFDFLPEIVDEQPQRQVDPTRAEEATSRVPLGERLRRASAYLATCEPAIQGQGGNASTWLAAAKMRGFALDEDQTFDLMLREFNPRCEPPWKDYDLARIVRNAYDYAKQPFGYLLVNDKVSAPDADITASLKSIETKLLQDKPVMIGSTNPGNVADRYLEKYSEDHLRKYKATWWAYTGINYVERETAQLKADLTLFCEALYESQVEYVASHVSTEVTKGVPYYRDLLLPRPVTETFIRDVLNAITARRIVPADVEMPMWLGTNNTEAPYISFANGLVSIKSLLAGKPSVLPHNPLWFSANSLPFSFDPSATCPRWESFVDQMLENDAERIELLQQWFGYCMVPDTSQQTFLMMEGQGSNGKSVIVKVLSGLLGDENVSSVALTAFAERFALNSTVGKLLNVCAEVSKLTPQIENIIKQFVGGDRITTDRKNIAPLQFVPTARLMITTNDRPQFTDKSNGLWRRLMILPFNVSVPDEDQIPDLDKVFLSEEAAGIFNWAIQGLQSLMARGKFTVPTISRETIEVYRQEDDPLSTFIRETFVEDAEHKERTTTVYNLYVQWANEKNERPISDADFGRQLRRVLPSVSPSKPAKISGKTVRCYYGIRVAAGASHDFLDGLNLATFA